MICKIGQVFIGKQITLPPLQIQVGIGRCTARAHSQTLYLEVVGVFETEPIVGQYETEKIQNEFIEFPSVMILLTEEGLNRPDALLMWDARI